VRCPVEEETMRHEEWHVTVEGDPVTWHQLLTDKRLRAGIKPLFIELNNFELQLMCASTFDPQTLIRMWNLANPAASFEIIRIKHEVSEVQSGETVLYWEAHAKIDGPFQPRRFDKTSRDLFRHNRWYVTKRREIPFNQEEFRHIVQTGLPFGCTLAEVEYEACLVDTNRELDRDWR